MATYADAPSVNVPEDKIDDQPDGFGRPGKPFPRQYADPKRWGAYVTTRDEISALRTKLAGQAEEGGSHELLATVLAMIEAQETQRLHGVALRQGADQAVLNAVRRMSDARNTIDHDPRGVARAKAAREFARDEYQAALGVEGDEDDLVANPAVVIRELLTGRFA